MISACVKSGAYIDYDERIKEILLVFSANSVFNIKCGIGAFYENIRVSLRRIVSISVSDLLIFELKLKSYEKSYIDSQLDSQSEAAIGTSWKYLKHVCEHDIALLYRIVGVVSTALAEVGRS